MNTESVNRRAAQELAYQAMDTRDPAEAAALCAKALALDPRCVDALVLSGAMLDDVCDCIALLSQALRIATEDLGGELYFKENTGYFWGLLETRPYMRARQRLAHALYLAGMPESAIVEYEALLELNPRDNQGVRYELIGLYLEHDNLEGARRLLENFTEDRMAVLAWSAVLERLIAGEPSDAEQALAVARKANPYVAGYLLGSMPMPSVMPGYHGCGDVNEAIFCNYILGGAWGGHPAALAWLRWHLAPEATVGADKTGRNDPCPCGSGKKYKKCCMGQPPTVLPQATSHTGARESALYDLYQAVEGRTFSSNEELNSFFQEYNEQRNRTPLSDFAGLSSGQMNQLLRAPFDSQLVVEFPPVLSIQPVARVAALFTGMAVAIGDDGLKPTATGNLPRKVAQDIALACLGETGYAEFTHFAGIRSELDYMELHATRFLAESAGLISKFKGKFILSRQCRNLLEQGGIQAIYPLLLRTYALRLDWACRDGYPQLGLIQDSFAFTLYLLDRFGTEWRESTFYEDAFLKAFPAIVNEVTPSEFETPMGVVRHAYTLRCLTRFAEFMGLVETDAKGGPFSRRTFKLRKTALLGAAASFVTQSAS